MRRWHHKSLLLNNLPLNLLCYKRLLPIQDHIPERCNWNGQIEIFFHSSFFGIPDSFWLCSACNEGQALCPTLYTSSTMHQHCWIMLVPPIEPASLALCCHLSLPWCCHPCSFCPPSALLKAMLSVNVIPTAHKHCCSCMTYPWHSNSTTVATPSLLCPPLSKKVISLPSITWPLSPSISGVLSPHQSCPPPPPHQGNYFVCVLVGNVPDISPGCGHVLKLKGHN